MPLAISSAARASSAAQLEQTNLRAPVSGRVSSRTVGVCASCWRCASDKAASSCASRLLTRITAEGAVGVQTRPEQDPPDCGPVACHFHSNASFVRP